MPGMMPTKILLVSPSKFEVYGKMAPPDYLPLGIAYLGAVLENAGHAVDIIDIDADGINDAMFVDSLGKGYDIVGFSITTPTFQNAQKLAELVKRNSKSTTVMGGIHATILPGDCLRGGHVDYVVRGEGERTILEFVDALAGKMKLEDVRGLSYMRDGARVDTPNRELIENLDEIPFPARHLFRQQKYTYPDALLSPSMPILSSRGCPHGCTYCATKILFSRRARLRSAKNLVDEIEQLILRYGLREVHFWDDNYTCNRKRVFEIRDEIKRRGIKINIVFASGLRVDQVDREILECLKDMGTYSMAFGVESGNQAVLDHVKKGTTLRQIEEAFSLAKEVGFETWGFFILGLPGDTPQSIRDTIEFAKKIDPDVAKFHILKPYPGTEAYEELRENGFLLSTDYAKYGIHTPPVHRLSEVTADELMSWQKRAYRKFYLRPGKIFKHLMRMKSWNRIKLNLTACKSVIKSMV